ncbi:hypothetical protein GYM69_07185 [Lactobacillus panisapium]|uniref:alpha/beta hydrolase family protein n=1 Tax=Lactobacillus panisapium TaxID=2012495 RepID=UPI001C6A34AB|nr:dienelactone hydrolase family protein [Lactobacillus panisapium]QYN56918.1 hypothetical protein GYM69_07185 [Lactobacillus panisapium]
MKEVLKFLKCMNHEVPMLVDFPDSGDRFPTVLLIHGFMSGKSNDNHMLKRISQKITEASIIAARIDLCSMGENLCSREQYGMKVMIAEVKASFKYLQSLPEVDENRVGLLGHSLGGRLAFTCSTLPAKLVIALNGAINTMEPIEVDYDKEQMNKLGYSIIRTADGRVELLFPRFEKDIKETLNNNIKQFSNPILIGVATSDPTLNPEISLNFIKNCHMSNVDSFTVDDSDHTFNVESGDFSKLNEVIAKVVPWLSEHI